jgi:origin recognition complex subunit 1
LPNNVVFGWTSAPLPPLESTKEGATRYNAFTCITTHTGGTPRIAKPLAPGRKIRAGKGDEESRFTVGDGVVVAIEGGGEGIGVLVGLWEEPDEDEEEEEDRDGDKDKMDKEGEKEGREGGRVNGREEGESSSAAADKDKSSDDDTPLENKPMRMVAEVHWCFRRQDLPGIMKNLAVADVSVFRASFFVWPCAS